MEAVNNDAIWNKRLEFIHCYGIAMVIVFYLAFQRTALFFQMCIHASRNLHDLLYRGITRSPMEFFNKNSSGRILNRFSNDIGNIDTLLPLASGDAILVIKIILISKTICKFRPIFSSIHQTHFYLLSYSSFWNSLPSCFW